MIVLPASAQPRVSIVIVSARRPARLLRCLSAIAWEAGDIEIEVIVVLNAAAPELAVVLGEEAQGVRVVASEVPLGYAGGANLGAREARGAFVHLLHDDTEVCPGWLDAMLAGLAEHPQAGAAGSLLVADDGSVQTVGHVLWRDGRTQPPWHGPAPDADAVAPTTSYVDYCASASLLVTREAWDAVGGYDERFHPAQYVDADLAMALREAGFVVICTARSRVRHGREGSASARLRRFLADRNRAQFVAKHADALAHQEPFADDADALERARRATLRRAAAVLANGRRRPPAVQSSPAGALEHLLRDLTVKDAFVAHLEKQCNAAEAHTEAAYRGLAELRAAAEEQAAAAAAHVAAANAALADLQKYAAALEDRHRDLEARYAELAAEREWLHARSRTLHAIENGGWWRLRGTLRRLAGRGKEG